MLAAAAPLLVAAAAQIADNETLMTVGRQQVKVGDYNRMIQKNAAAAAADESTDSRIDRFALYKMKVQAARDAGLDTIESHRKELDNYRRELAAPYMFDHQMRDSLVQVAYDHMGKLVTVSHLWLQPRSEAELASMSELADSVRRAVEQGADFNELIKKYSTEQGAAQTGGRLTIIGGMTPYEFEDRAFNTPIGQLSPVFRSRMGIHLLRPEAVAANPGEVKARHILKRFRDPNMADSATVRASIDSIAALLAAGADFKTLASAETEDPSGRTTAGDLPWFGPGRMVPEFEKAAFALADGQLSAPVRTAYGYHIILKEGARPIAPLDSVRKNLEEAISRDSRASQIHARAARRYAAAEGIVLDREAVKKAVGIVGLANRADSSMIPTFQEITLFTINGKPHTADRALANLIETGRRTSGASARSAIDNYFQRMVQERMLETLPEREPEYARLTNSYDEDLLVYEVSNREVWDRANTDTEGLEKYFQAHRKDFSWQRPHYIGWVISAENDSLADAAVAYLTEFPADTKNYGQELRKRFTNKVKIDQVNSAAGQFPIIDYVAFSGTLPAPNGRWTAFRPFRGQVVEQPRSAADVKGAAGMAYQKQLEEQWLKQLRKRYPVKINKKAAKQLR